MIVTMDEPSVCSWNCMKKIPPQVLETYKSEYFSHCSSEQSRLQYFLDFLSGCEYEGKGRYKYMIGHIRVCGNCLTHIFEVPRSRFDTYLARHEMGQRRAELGLKGIPQTPNPAKMLFSLLLTLSSKKMEISCPMILIRYTCLQE